VSDLIAFRPDWLDKIREPALEPELPICDSHHHLWDMGGNTYVNEGFQRDMDSGLAGEATHNVVSTVFVECTTSYDDAQESYSRYLGETRFAEKLAEKSERQRTPEPRIAAAIIARADVDKYDTLPLAIAAHRAMSPGRFRGFRHVVNWDAEPEIGQGHAMPGPRLLLSRDFQKGAALLAEHGLLFETVALHTQLEDVITFSRKLPRLRIVLNHMGCPVGVGRFSGQRESVFKDWSAKMAALAQCGNVFVKLGGINMTRYGFAWHTRSVPPTSDELAEVTGRYYRTVIDCFGPERCMFESNFPMDKISCSYGILWNAYKKITAPLPGASRRRLFCDTAETLYEIRRTEV